MKMFVVICFGMLLGVSGLELPVATWYAQQMSQNPILTKSMTAATVFAASDITAQRIEGQKKLDKVRLLMTTAIGGLYFAPAAHFWYNGVTAILPLSTIPHIIGKAALGQLFFGPLVTCVFFAAACLQTKQNLFKKVKRDLIPVQLAGIGYWPFVDLISFSLIPIDYIPVFINFASFIWTIFLSYKARRGLQVAVEEDEANKQRSRKIR
uniref:Protein Mpv17 n=1 Tax=Aureoumbra lagunensis TaxID=44058 RepID=A0A7S3JT70_9STRA|mmetsp:Transcript_12765/g.19156  ORF Transcript_12765/g.19156 Transcript_12765/m.19156 type:complete len:209 (-) Transcript_12765:22-648(-)